MNTKRYIKSFNQGYFLARFAPRILHTLKAVGKQNTTFLEPFVAGQRQYKKERIKHQLRRITGKMNNEREIWSRQW